MNHHYFCAECKMHFVGDIENVVHLTSDIYLCEQCLEAFVQKITSAINLNTGEVNK